MGASLSICTENLTMVKHTKTKHTDKKRFADNKGKGNKK